MPNTNQHEEGQGRRLWLDPPQNLLTVHSLVPHTAWPTDYTCVPALEPPLFSAPNTLGHSDNLSTQQPPCPAPTRHPDHGDPIMLALPTQGAALSNLLLLNSHRPQWVVFGLHLYFAAVSGHSSHSHYQLSCSCFSLLPSSQQSDG